MLDFHYRFERIHPFQDGNAESGAYSFQKECLRNNIVPFIIEDDIKMFYYRGLKGGKTSAATCVIPAFLHRTGLRSIWTIFESHMTNNPPLCDTETDCFFVISPCVYAVKM